MHTSIGEHLGRVASRTTQLGQCGETLSIVWRLHGVKSTYISSGRRYCLQAKTRVHRWRLSNPSHFPLSSFTCARERHSKSAHYEQEKKKTIHAKYQCSYRVNCRTTSLSTKGLPSGSRRPAGAAEEHSPHFPPTRADALQPLSLARRWPTRWESKSTTHGPYARNVKETGARGEEEGSHVPFRGRCTKFVP